MNEQQMNDARDLLQRAGYAEADEIPDDALCYCLETVVAVIDDRPAPDVSWFRDYYTLTGEHAVLTDEGWGPGDGDYEDNEIVDEVNKPAEA